MNVTTNDPVIVMTVGFSNVGNTNQVAIQFQDEGINLGAGGTVDKIDFVGTGLTVTRVGNKLTVTASGSGSGSVISVGGLSPLFTVANPTSTPTFTAINQAPNIVYAGPTSGADAAPTFRSLVIADIPDLSSTYQPLDGDLTAIAALGFSSSSLLRKTAANTWVLDTNTYLTQSVADGLYQPLDSDLTTIAGLTATTDNFIVSVANAWASRTPAQVKSTLSLNLVENTSLSTWAGSTNLVTVGTLTSGATGAGFTIALGSSTITGALPVANGGTNLTSYAVGDLIYASGATTLSKLAAVAVGSYVASKGLTTAPAYVAFPYVTPEMYGAVADGSADDATAITNAIASGIPVYFSQKNYKVGSTITTASNTKLFGSGYGSIISTTANIAIITIGGINNAIEGIHFQGNSTGAAQTGITAVGNGSFNQYRYSNQITNCIFTGLNFAGLYTINTIGNSSGSEHQGTYYAVNCYAYSCGTGFFMDTRGEYNQFSNCHASNCTNGLQFKGGNNSWTGGSLTDNTVNALIGSGANDGHGVICGAKINHGNITCSSTATGFAFVGCEIVATSITLTSCTDIRFYDCDIASSPITSTSAVGTIFSNNCFRTTPTITIAAGNNPFFFGNTFPSGSTVHSLIVNTMQGGLTITQQGPTSPSTETATWTTTASAQYAHKITGTITPRATASDTFNGFWVNLAFTATAANQVFSQMKIDGAMATGGQSGTSLFALDVSGRTQIKDPASSGSTGTLELLTSGSSTIVKWSADAIQRIGNAGSPPQFSPTSDGTTTAIGGNAVLLSASGLGWNFTVTNSGAGTVSSRTLRIGGGSTTSSGSTTWSGILADYTINQTGSSTGVNYFLRHSPTITSTLTQSYFIVDNSALPSGLGTLTPTAKLELAGNMSATTWTTVGIQLALDAATYTDTGTAGTRATGVAMAINRPTFASTNAVTITDAASLYIANDVAASGGNMTLTRTHALWVAAGISRFDGKVQIGSGISADGGGMKHARVTTGSVSAGSTALVTITWTTAFADANYTVVADVIDSTTSSLSLSVVHVESVTASAVTVRVLNNAIGSLTGTVQVIACHD